MTTESVSSRPKNDEAMTPAVISDLLRNGSAYSIKRWTPREQIAKRMRVQGLIDFSETEYVKCVNHEDRDYTFIRQSDRSCRGIIDLDASLDEQRNDYACPQCGRFVYPSRKKKYDRIKIAVRQDGVLSFIETVLGELGLDFKRIGNAHWRIDIGVDECHLVVIEYCDEQQHAREWAATRKVCYVVVNAAGCKDKFVGEDWLTWTLLADIVCKHSDLKGCLERAVSSVPQSTQPLSVPVFSNSVRPVSMAPSPRPAEKTGPVNETWPDPEIHTIAQHWTLADKTFCFQTKTNERKDGTAKFYPNNGVLSNGAKILKMLCCRRPKPLTLGEIVNELFRDEYNRAADDKERKKIIKRAKTAVSDIRKKFVTAKINPEVIDVFGPEADLDASISLKVSYVRDQDARARIGGNPKPARN